MYFPLSGYHKTFLFSYMKYLCFLKFLLDKIFMKVNGLGKKFQDDRAGLDPGASDLQSITYTTATTEDLLAGDGLI